jgi:hypothetical protein
MAAQRKTFAANSDEFIGYWTYEKLTVESWRARAEASTLLKTLSESFDAAQDERRGVEIAEDFPYMLRFSKHS